MNKEDILNILDAITEENDLNSSFVNKEDEVIQKWWEDRGFNAIDISLMIRGLGNSFPEQMGLSIGLQIGYVMGQRDSNE